jgi:hypothetical protein
MSKATEQVVDTSAEILNGFLTKSVEYLNSAEAFLKAEVPSFIQEYMAWEFYSALFSGSLWLIATIFLIWIGVKLIKARNHDNMPGEIALLVAGFTLLFTISNFYTMVKIKVAPRVYLLQELREQIR